MSDSGRSDDRPDRDREDLSALLDGELSPEREAELRASLARRPELAEALALLGEADQQVRALAGRPVPDDALARMRAGLDAKLRADAPPVRAEGADVIELPTRRRWVAVAAAALAAGLALYLGVGRSPSPPSQGLPGEEQWVETPAPSPDASAPLDAPREPVEAPGAQDPAPSLAKAPAGLRTRPLDPAPIVTATQPSDAAPGPPEQATEPVEATALAAQSVAAPDTDASGALLEAASEEDLAIALDYETLADFEVIAQLDLLELLAELDDVEEM